MKVDVENEVKKFNAPWRERPRNPQCDCEPRSSWANGEVALVFDRVAMD